MPFQTSRLPFLKPLDLLTRTNEELHLHLLELAHTEDKLTSHDLITERLTDLGDTERDLHTASLLHIQEVHENTLGRLRTKINLHRSISGRTHIRREHQVKLANLRPVTSSGNRANDLAIQDQLAKILEVRLVHRLTITLMNLIPFRLMLQYTRIRLTEFSLIESVTEFLCGFRHFLIYFLLDLAQMVLDQNVRTVTFLRVLVIDQRIIKSVNMAGSFPDSRVHKNSGINTHYILMQQSHAIPPIFLYIIL